MGNIVGHHTLLYGGWKEYAFLPSLPPSLTICKWKGGVSFSVLFLQFCGPTRDLWCFFFVLNSRWPTPADAVTVTYQWAPPRCSLGVRSTNAGNEAQVFFFVFVDLLARSGPLLFMGPGIRILLSNGVHTCESRADVLAARAGEAVRFVQRSSRL